MAFAVLADNSLKIKESEKSDKCFDLARELKKLWNMKVTVIQIVIGTPGMVFKSVEKGLQEWETRERIKTIQTTALLRLARILRKVLEICNSDSRERQSTKVGMKIS